MKTEQMTQAEFCRRQIDAVSAGGGLEILDTACPYCDGPGTMLGKMCRRLFLRCRNCGMDYSLEV